MDLILSSSLCFVMWEHYLLLCCKRKKTFFMAYTAMMTEMREKLQLKSKSTLHVERLG